LKTHWDQGRKTKNNSPHPTPKKEKQCVLSLPIGCMKFGFPKLFVTIFGLG
jgi:hypothetical protein